MVRPLSKLTPATARPVDEVFALNAEFIEDPSPLKVNLSIGVYRTEEGLPWPPQVVEDVQDHLHATRDIFRHEYLTPQGDVDFLKSARDLAFDFEPNSTRPSSSQHRIVSVQTVSGTGANHIGAKYLSQVLKPKRVWLPDPTWGNHFAIWELVGVKVCTYPYYDPKTPGVNFAGIVHVLETQAEPGDVVLFHACAHNPTGCDPSHDEWLLLVEVCRRCGLIPFLDSAYQGFASGDVSMDAFAVKAFLAQPDLEFCVAQSFSKNFGLYGQRAGALHVVVSGHSNTPSSREAILTNLCHLIRGEFSMAPRTGSDIVRTALQTPSFRAQWLCDLATMSGRIKDMRRALYHELVRLETPGSWVHVVNQIGMFSYTGLTEAQVIAIREKHHVYMLVSGRISMSGVTSRNVAYIARAIDDVVRKAV